MNTSFPAPRPTPLAKTAAAKRVALCLAIFALFAGMRACLYASAPPSVDWYLRDTVMNAPRLLCLGLICLVMRGKWQRATLRRKPALLLAASEFSILAMLFTLRPLQSAGSFYWFAIFALSSIVVGVYEEVSFRGALLQSLCEWKNDRIAIFFSALTFMVFHIQAQPLSEWPWLFLIGVKFAFARLLGAPLWALIVIHSVYDAAFIFLGAPTHPTWFWSIMTSIEMVTAVGFWITASALGSQAKDKRRPKSR